MANELSVNFSASYAKGTIKEKRVEELLAQFTVANSKFYYGVQAIGTSQEALVTGEIVAANLGFYFIKNLDATNYVKLRSAVAGDFLVRLGPGKFTMGWFEPSAAPYLIADTAACNVEVFLVEA